MSNLPIPKTNKAEVLHTLITEGCVSIEEFFYMCGFRTRISELVNKDKLPLQSMSKQGINKFGNTYTYTEHILPENLKETAITVYNNINRPR
jgi:hypothetical protein